MPDLNASLHGLFSRNRAEELGHDVWEHFVVPPFFDRLDLQTARKPRVIIAGRGCGKTMLLRYLSHESAFSIKRDVVPDAALGHIGLYWRADTQFAHAMCKRDVADDIWESAFNHLLALVIGIELLESLASIAKSSSSALAPADLATLDLSRASEAFDDGLPGDYEGLLAGLEQRLWSFQAWVNDVRVVSRPRLLPGRYFLLALIKLIREQLPALGSSTFFVYLDEYENLLAYQKDIVHTCLKHSEAADGLIFNLAVKRGVIDAPHTVGAEALLNIHDWRYHDLEQYLLESDFPVFAAEILFLQLSLADVPALDVPIDVAALRDPFRINARQSPAYAAKILTAVRQIFPGQSHRELAAGVFQERPLLDKLRLRIETGLRRRNSTASADDFLVPDQPQASVIVPALLYRSRMSPTQVLEELGKLRTGNPVNSFTGRADWQNNYFVGCLLQLYGPYSRACPFYAGFDTFCDMAHGSLRHILELCHQAVGQSLRGNDQSKVSTSPLDQATAAHLASALFLDEIRKFGPYGIHLHAFVLRLGSLFALAQDRPSQSQAEITHFSVGRGVLSLTEEDEAILAEAVKWSVLFREKTTKRREVSEPQSEEYVLNPIYAPYFHISFRRRKKLTLPTEQVIVMIRGNYDDFRRLLNDFSRRWGVNLSDRPTLFAHLDTEATL